MESHIITMSHNIKIRQLIQNAHNYIHNFKDQWIVFSLSINIDYQ